MMGSSCRRYSARANVYGRKFAAIVSDDVLSDDGRNGDPLRLLLYGCSRLYGRIVEIRTRRMINDSGRVRRLPRPVVSVGNLTTGGTGKTPMAAYLAGLIGSWGLNPVILSRGYGGSAERCGAIVSSGKGPLVPPEVAGDEAYLLAQRLPEVPVVVGRDRHAMGASVFEQFRPDCYLLDDGFQHIRLHRDLNLVLLDYKRPFGNGHLLPRGHLRESRDALERADAIVLTRSDVGTKPLDEVMACSRRKPVFRAAHHSVVVHHWNSGKYLEILDKKHITADLPVYIFSGIADNGGFQDAVKKMGARPVGHRAFADHHPYSRKDIDTIKAGASGAGAKALVTTAKDFVRLPRPLTWAVDLWVADVELTFANDDFATFVRSRLKRLLGG
jgi:tetraacyldisaccharide 4'-kinase